MKRMFFFCILIVSANFLFSDTGIGFRFTGSVGNSSQKEMAEIGVFLQPGITIGSKVITFSLLGDLRLFGYPQITVGLITGFTLGNDISFSLNIGGGFSNPKFTAVFNGDLYQPYIRGMSSAGIFVDTYLLISLGVFFDYYFDSRDLYDHNFRTGICLSFGNV